MLYIIQIHALSLPKDVRRGKHVNGLGSVNLALAFFYSLYCTRYLNFVL